MERSFFTSESVTEGHPDKICDQISDAVLDEILEQDKKARVACETFVTVGLVVVGGEITTTCYVDLPEVVRSLVRDIGYINPAWGFHYKTCAILNAIGHQSPDIAQGVDRGGAGDQGTMIGYAIKETPELMPLPIQLAHRLVKRLAYVRKNKILSYLGPDGKSQVTVEYIDKKPVRVEAIIISTQHTEDILDPSDPNKITEESKEEIKREVILPIVPEELIDEDTKFFINPTGKFIVGGPMSDTGMTGRKIIVDTYGGKALHGGGAFSGKDPTKVDRSAAYMARHIAKNIVAGGIADECAVYISYSIGVEEPIALDVDTFNTSEVPKEKLLEIIYKNFDLTPKGIIEYLSLLRPIYRKTACYGHFGREDPEFSWEKIDRTEDIKRDL